MKLLSAALGDEQEVGRIVSDNASETTHEYARTFIDRRIKKEQVEGKKKPGRKMNVYDQGLIYKGQKRRELDLGDYPVLLTDSPTFLPYIYLFEVDPLRRLIGNETRDLIRRDLEYDAFHDALEYDLILFLPPRISFKKDPTRWQKDDQERQRISDRIEAFLKLYKISYVTIQAMTRAERKKEALSHIVPLLEKEFAPPI